MREVQLDHAFAEALQGSADFRTWLLAGGRFARHASAARLMCDEQATARKAAHWWKHWWTGMPDGTQSETDIFAVFEAGGGDRFALHIENKPLWGDLSVAQAAGYRRRAAFKANDPRWLDYRDFETLLVAPAGFLRAHPDCVAQFDRAIPYEEVAGFSPMFGEALGVGGAR